MKKDATDIMAHRIWVEQGNLFLQMDSETTNLLNAIFAAAKKQWRDMILLSDVLNMSGLDPELIDSVSGLLDLTIQFEESIKETLKNAAEDSEKVPDVSGTKACRQSTN